MSRSRERAAVREAEAVSESRAALEDELHKLRTGISVDAVQMTELQDSLEAEQYFTTLYKTQVKELKEELEDKTKIIGDLEKDLTLYQEKVATECLVCDGMRICWIKKTY